MWLFFKKTLQTLYQQYELVTCIYMFEPWEKKLINGFVALIMGLVLFSSFMYLPSYIETFMQFLMPLEMEGGKSASVTAPLLQAKRISIS